MTYNVSRIGDGAALTRKISCYNLIFETPKIVKLAIPPHYCQYDLYFTSIKLIPVNKQDRGELAIRLGTKVPTNISVLCLVLKS